jgi:SAM-dependent methyltransferase
MMRKIENYEFYTSSLKKYGLDVKALHWNSDESQQIRFDTLLKLIPQDITTLNIADAGCGFGDLYLYMKKKPLSYIGLETMKQMCQEARNRTGCKILHVNILRDTLPQADYYICSGAMNILSRFDTYLFIRRCVEHSKKGFIFNILQGEDESMVYNYFQPNEIKKMAEKLSLTCKIKTGYLERDMSIGFYK